MLSSCIPSFHDTMIHYMCQGAACDLSKSDSPPKWEGGGGAAESKKNFYRNISISGDTIEVLEAQKKKVTGEYVFPSPNGFWSVGCLKGKNRSCFGSAVCFLPPFVRRIFHCFRPALPAPILFWVKSGSEAVISGGTGELQPCATVHTIYPHTTNGVKASVSWVYLSITAVASASVTE